MYIARLFVVASDFWKSFIVQKFGFFKLSELGGINVQDVVRNGYSFACKIGQQVKGRYWPMEN